MIQNVLSSMLHMEWNQIISRCVVLGVDLQDTTQCYSMLQRFVVYGSKL